MNQGKGGEYCHIVSEFTVEIGYLGIFQGYLGKNSHL